MKSNTEVTSILDTISQNMCLIPAGSFLMGAEGWGASEAPIHEVYVDAFLMDESPVTNEQFAEFVAKTGYSTTAEQKGSAFGYENGNIQEIKGLSWKSYFTRERVNHPVVLVSWYDADAYAKWAGKRLPTEAEWEKAARGGLVQMLYAWGNDEPQENTCNFGKETTNMPATTTIKSYAPNVYGLYDMGGNVWNWCQDWFSETYYSQQASNFNPQGAESGNTKVRKGASFNIIQTFRLRCSNRGAYKPEEVAINIGFRCAKNL
jgi:formylglycine-generating enzyme